MLEELDDIIIIEDDIELDIDIGIELDIELAAMADEEDIIIMELEAGIIIEGLLPAATICPPLTAVGTCPEGALAAASLYDDRVLSEASLITMAIPF